MLTKILSFCLALVTLPAWGGGGPAELPAVLYTTYREPVPAAVERAIEDEVETLMGPLGRHFAWRPIATVKGNEISSELAVLTFRGHCDVGSLGTKDLHPGALGWTHVSDGAILPFSEIDCDRIRVFLQRELLFLRPLEREEAYGHAVGRVVAHELYHIFANTQHHGADGVGKSAYTVQELLSDEFQFEEKEGDALRSSVPRPAGRGAIGPP